MKKALAFALLVGLCIYSYIHTNSTDQDPYLITDYSKLHPVKVERVVTGKEEQQLIETILEAKEKNLKVSIAGQRHSQGGHTYYEDGIVVDISAFNKIVSFDPSAKKITVQAGATWADIQDRINPYGLSIKTMQSQNIFTVGGSISINAHGRDIRNGSLIKSVESFKLLMADGQVIQVSRSQNPELFRLALGGFGLFGIILEVTLSLAEDELYTISTDVLARENYVSYFTSKVLPDRDVHMHIARISVAPDSYLTEMYAMNYRVDRTMPLKGNNKLATKEQGVIPAKLLFHLNRSFDWGKQVLWDLQTSYFKKQDGNRISRNNVMRSDSEFMEYRKAGRNDLLQEYFIPVEKFDRFIEVLGPLLKEEDLNLLNITVRYVNQDQEAALSYAREDMFALVLLFNVSLTDSGQEKAQQGIQRIIDAALRQGGTYYLPYVAYPTVKQFRSAYPEQASFFDKKRQYDPTALFTNYFHEKYKGE
ncbi:FAD-dependent oxidoreductase [Cohnella sp.]|uniref:FAD-dependent oxidoreductase n=1 Tax=Cohnella sp. TaxID=1883426 RepID=UPI0035666CA5